MAKLQGRIIVTRLLEGTLSRGQYVPPPVQGGGSVLLQRKEVEPKNVVQIVSPDSGYGGLSEVEVKAVVLQSKMVAPSKDDIFVQPDDDYVGLSLVQVIGVPYTESVDFSGYEDGYFEETLGDGSVVRHEIEWGDDGVPAKVDSIAVSGISIRVTGV